MTYKQTFTIKKSAWLRGEGSFHSRLYRPSDGKQCCLGQIGLQCGATIEQVTIRAIPFQADNIFWPEILFADDITFVCNAVSINDDRDTDDEHKMNSLTKLFNNNGYGLEFVE